MVGICRQYQMTLVLVTHDPSIAQYADRIVTLIDGAIVSDVENQSIAEPVYQDNGKAKGEEDSPASENNGPEDRQLSDASNQQEAGSQNPDKDFNGGIEG